MNFPNNEGKACDAVIRHLEKWTGETRAGIRHPEKDGIGPPVELRLQLGNQNYAIEHTRVESFDNQIKANISIREIKNYIKEGDGREFEERGDGRWDAADAEREVPGGRCAAGGIYWSSSEKILDGFSVRCCY